MCKILIKTPGLKFDQVWSMRGEKVLQDNLITFFHDCKINHTVKPKAPGLREVSRQLSLRYFFRTIGCKILILL